METLRASLLLPNRFQIIRHSTQAPVAKLDKAPVYETGESAFESRRVRQNFNKNAALEPRFFWNSVLV